MGTQIGTGISHHRNEMMAAKEAVGQALSAAQIEKPDFIIFFSTVGYDQETIVKAAFREGKQSTLIGCSTEGVISIDVAEENNFTAGAIAFKSDEFTLSAGLAEGFDTDSFAVGKTVGETIQSIRNETTAGLLTFTDGLKINFDQFNAGLKSEISAEPFLPMLGGLAGENWQMTTTYQYFYVSVVKHGAVWGLLSGDLELVWAVDHGCYAIGNERKVTRCERNIIYEIDGKPALDVMEEYLSPEEVKEWQIAMMNLCIGFKTYESMRKDYDEFIIRHIASKDDDEKSLFIATEFEEGDSIWMTRRDPEKMTKGVENIANKIHAAIKEKGRQPKCILHFDCAGRGRSLFSEKEKMEILKLLQDKTGRDFPWMGCYTYGELAPVNSENCFHNFSAVVCALF